ncbi:heme exporter protein CcmB [Woodsholea maritima]|uniref:heme exporter protein CcmB n=1 Tax=Woodsholea maritima TaxID=240237 RepID=UPI00037C3D16|nr:heme exporter protein CcmB [Woodsholea maritima]
MTFVALWALFKREAKLAWAGGGGAAGPAAFNLAALALAPLAMGPSPELLSQAGPGIVAFSLLLSTLQPAERLFGDDVGDGTLDLYALCGQSLTLISLVKTLAFAFAVFWPAPMIALIGGLAYGLPFEAAATLAFGLSLAIPGLAMITAFAGALAAGIKRSGLLIALIAAPLQTPLLIFAAGAGREALNATGRADANLLLTLAVSLMLLVLSPAGIAAALKARLD